MPSFSCFKEQIKEPYFLFLAFNLLSAFWRLTFSSSLYHGMVSHACNPSYFRGKERKIIVWGWPGQTVQDPIWKITKVDGWDVAQVMECLPSKYEVLSLKSSTKLGGVTQAV
jgi:hypothetical protein